MVLTCYLSFVSVIFRMQREIDLQVIVYVLFGPTPLLVNPEANTWYVIPSVKLPRLALC